jgi:hypothetical protein
MDIGVRVRLQARPFGAVALGVGHGHAQRQILILDTVHVVEKALGIVGAMGVVGAPGCLEDSVHGVMREIALRAAGHFADEAYRLQLVKQIG